MYKDSSNENYGHSFPEALFPLFKSDKEYELIKSVLLERFRDQKKNIMIMYKYLASQNIPKIVLFSSQLPFGIVIKRLPPEKAWNEVICSKILTKLHPFDFNVIYHESLGCISEKYLIGYDVMTLPVVFLSDNNYIALFFYWLGKCACVAHVLAIGDRGHNERLHCKEREDLFNISLYTRKSEPIINIDFEDFLSKRVNDINVDATEIALLFYSVLVQIPKKLRINIDIDKLFDIFYKGFTAKLDEIKIIWANNKNLFKKYLKKLFKIRPQNNSMSLIRALNERATGNGKEVLFDNAYRKLTTGIEKMEIDEREKRAHDLLKQKKKLIHFKDY